MRSGGSSGRFAPEPRAGAGAAGAGRTRPPLPLIYALTITGVLANTLVAPVVPDILDDLGVSQSSAGLVLSAATLPGIVLAPVIGVLADRFGRREVLIPCLVLFGLGGTLNALAPSFTILLILRFVQGIGSAGLVNLAVVLIGDHWEGVDRARRMGHNAAALTTALAILPPLGGALGELVGWRAVFLPYGAAFLTAVAVARLVPPSPRHDTSMRAQLRQARPYLASRHMGGLIVMAVLVFVVIFGLFLTVMPLYLRDRFGLEAGARGLMLSLPALTSTVAAASVGWLRARHSRDRLLRASWVVFVVSFAGVAAVPSLAMVAAASLLYGLSEGVVLPLLQDEAAGIAPATSRGAVVAVWVGAARAGQTLGPVMAGAGADGFGARATFAAGAFVAVALAGVQAATTGPEPYPSDEPVAPEPPA